VLLGCETGSSAAPFQDFVAAFRRSGAALVLGTLSEILGRQAGPVAQELTQELRRQLRDRPTPFGDVLLTVRRKLLQKGLTVVLALIAYGDADWLLET
jgi:hypothetical protein